MDSQLLKAKTSVFLVVDVQARLAPAISNREDILRNIEILGRAAARLGIPVTTIRRSAILKEASPEV